MLCLEEKKKKKEIVLLLLLLAAVSPADSNDNQGDENPHTSFLLSTLKKKTKTRNKS